MLEEEILLLADEEDWTPDTLLALLTDFLTQKKLEAETMVFLRTRTADAMIEAGL